MKFKKQFSTAIKNVLRQKFVTIAQVSVITLAFLVLSIIMIIFIGVVYFSNYLETRPNLEVYFKIGAGENEIMQLKKDLENTGKTVGVEYISEIDAVAKFKQVYQYDPVITGSVEDNKAGQLNSSLEIRAQKLDYLKDLNGFLEQKAKDKPELIDEVKYLSESSNKLNDLLGITRVFSACVIGILIFVLLSISLLTVQFTVRNRSEEIKVMQLVGASSWSVRTPFIIEGAIYGFLGGLVASLIIIIGMNIIIVLKDHSPTLKSVFEFFADVRFPNITIFRLLLFVILESVLGTILGALNHLIAVKKYLR